MKVIIKIAWRNIWRNPLRSSVVITAIALGLWAGLFVMSLVLGLNEQRMNGAINYYLSHLQIHHPQYLETPKLKHSLQDNATALDYLKKDSRIKAFSERTCITGMVANSNGSYGVQILGIQPEKEKTTTVISANLDEGTYFENSSKNNILIGKKLAEKLKLKLKSKLVLTFQDLDQNMVSLLFKVSGIYKTTSSAFEETTLFVHQKDLAAQLGQSIPPHELVAVCNSIADADAVKKDLQKSLPNDQVQTWLDIAPELGYAQKMMSEVVYIFMLIILIALSFSIVNTMLMAVLERKKELAMLRAIGMNRRNLFLMIAFETVFIAMVAAPIGIFGAYLTISYFSAQGIDLSMIAEGLESLGVGALIYPFLPAHLYLNISLLTLLVAFLSSLIPARKAIFIIDN